jgi:hypothetical protein
MGTFAPLFADERFFTGPVGRLLISNVSQIPTPPGSTNNGNGLIALAPAVLQRNGNTISADFCGTFPDNFNSDNGTNPKYDLGKAGQVRGKRDRSDIGNMGRRLYPRHLTQGRHLDCGPFFARDRSADSRPNRFAISFCHSGGLNGRPHCTLRRSDSSSCTSSSRLTRSSQSGGMSIGHVAINNRSSVVP